MAEQQPQPSNQVPDLATVLRNLAALKPQQPQHAAPTRSTTPPGYPTYPVPQANSQQFFAQPTGAALADPSRPNHHDFPRGFAAAPQQQLKPAPPVIDPATITEWSQGLRCVSKIAAQNPSFQGQIQRMMADQATHELMWHGSRKALQAQRASAAELHALDAKIHKASREMVAVMSGQLKGLGVPFFGMKAELVVQGEREAPKGKVTETQVLGLQRRMVSYLEDMYRV
ncbi:uncharacterized protein K452DRAFT_239038 [Aplosporella prunicola CBS 121167]|uniref:Uncharacterized protein n=1 Tax=Aplosporella prunicola CBS 121167 TaxID=1176127 RepID=A0A6A6AUE2_9PEZI|nr:uncharacterized protein K452DRAFT_239038 [Aplosporella prunicola CBS 121167]KAF2135622.1 hypothetical protein K452DRAFT_239038 [Aplosporella prunicola CBS 121167]